MKPDRHSLRLRTPEGVQFSFTLATPVTRFAAWFVDKLAFGAAWTIIASLLSVLSVLEPDSMEAVGFLGYFLFATGGAIAMEWLWDGKTLGKRLLGIRVMDEKGLPLQFSQILLRNLLRCVDSLPVGYLVGGLCSWFSKKSQRAGDLAAATVVIREFKYQEKDYKFLTREKYNSLRGRQVVIARLRTGVSPLLGQAAMQALMRREELDPAERVSLFADFAKCFREVAKDETTLADDLSDETVVRNVVEVLFDSPVRREQVATSERN